MKKLLLTFFMCSFLLVNGQGKNNVNGNGNLIGYINKSDFLNGKHSDWFSANYKNYQPDKKIVQKISKKLKNISISFFGFIYISISLSLFYAMRGMFLNSAMSMFFPNIELMVPILVIVTVWVNDTMAYIVGSFIGRTPISPISPKKTWEGTIAGVILSVVLLSSESK